MEMKGAAYAQLRDRDADEDSDTAERDAPAETQAQEPPTLDPGHGECTIDSMATNRHQPHAELDTTADTVDTLVLCRCRDARLGMKAARLWAKLVNAGLIADPADPTLRMLSVSAFVVGATANAPERSRVLPGLAVRTSTRGAL